MEINRLPYEILVLVCVNDREPPAPSCGPNGGHEIRDLLREEVRRRGLAAQVRVSQVKCLGQCADGPNVMVLPKGTWFKRVTTADVPDIILSLFGD